jgi:dihydrofolate reductase
MRRLISSLNVTVDGFRDHTALVVDEEHHRYAVNLLNTADAVVFGRVTYQLFESYWPAIAKEQSGTGAAIEFARKIDSLNKIVLSKTLDRVEWHNARLISGDATGEINKLKQQSGKDLLILGSPGLVSSLLQMGLIDELQLLLQPIILGKGQLLFPCLTDRIDLKLIEAKTFSSGVVVHRYAPK